MENIKKTDPPLPCLQEEKRHRFVRDLHPPTRSCLSLTPKLWSSLLPAPSSIQRRRRSRRPHTALTYPHSSSSLS